MARKRIKLWHLAVGIPVLCGLGGWITVAVAERNARGKIERELSLLRKMGVPTTADDMRRRVPPERNAAILYRRAIAAYKTGPKLTKYFSKATREDLAKWAEGNRTTLAFLRDAAKRPDCYFTRKWEETYLLSFPEYSEMKEFTRLVCAEAGRQASLGNFEAASGWLKVGFTIAQHVREKTLMAQLVTIANEALVTAELHDILGRYGTDSRLRSAMHQVVDRLGPIPSIVEGVQGEVVFAHGFFDGIRAGSVNAEDVMGRRNQFDLEMMAMRVPMLRERVEASVLRRQRHLLERLVPVRDDSLAVEKVLSDFDRSAPADDSLHGKLASDFFPIFSQAGQAVVKLVASRNVTQAALWAFDERAQRGQFPAKLDTAQVWAIDPFTQAPLRYERTGAEFKLYSMGPNKADDGGVFGYSAPGSKRGDDVAFRGFRK